jgi:probable F420-dependent oxidoreductase
MVEIGTIGVWTSSRQWDGDSGELADAAAELEESGYGALWLGSSDGDLALHESLLAATSRLVVGSGIIDVWSFPADVVAAAFHRVAAAHPGRFVLGLGSGHAEFVEAATGQPYVKPYSKLVDYLHRLDAADPPIRAGDRVLAALGPRTLSLAGRRTAGAFPYLVTPEFTAGARERLGAGPRLVVEQKVVLEDDPAAARTLGRGSLALYLRLPNYVANMRRMGFDDADFADGGSDRLVDALVAWGDEATVRQRIDAHLAAGADHVAAQVLPPDHTGDLPRAGWRRLAGTLVA